MQISVVQGLSADHEAAVNVWRAANIARLLSPGQDRVARIREKLADLDGCLVIARVGATGEMLAMALAEPGRAEHGAGSITPGHGHVSMVFVRPEMWGRGVGRSLLQGLHERTAELGWSRTTLWTRASNGRARSLYSRQGYQSSGHETTLGDGDPILQLERRAH